MQLHEFTIGCDPEIFVKKNGKPISAHGLIPGTKKAPHKTSCGAVQVDGMAFEFNTDPVSLGDFETFNRNVVKTIADLRLLAGDVNFAIQPVMDFDPEYIEAQPDEAKELGCDPDYCAYTLEPNPRPDGQVPFRTAAGHFHIGWGADIPYEDPEHIEICAEFVKRLDAYLGLFCTIADSEPRRRELYGKAGAFRPKPYGVEYRTPSNFWLKNKELRKICFSLIQNAVQSMRTTPDSERFYNFISRTPEEVRAIIDNGDYVAAWVILNRVLRYHFLFSMVEKLYIARIAQEGN